MFADFMFSVNIVFPIFLVIFAGYGLKKTNFVSGEFIRIGNKLVFNFALPASLFKSVYNSDIRAMFDINFILFAVITSVISFFAIWFIASLFIKDRPAIGVFVQGSFRGNFAILGMPILINIIGNEAAAKGALIITFIVPIYNVLSIVVLTVYAKSNKAVNVKGILLSIVKNPLIIGIFIGFIFSLLQIRLPLILERTVDYFAALSTPLAILCLGGSFRLEGFGAKFKFAALASAIKIMIVPAIFLPVAFWFGFRSDELAVLLVMYGVPSAVSSYTMAVQMDGDSYIASTIVVLTSLCSVFTLTIFIYIFKMLGLIA